MLGRDLLHTYVESVVKKVELPEDLHGEHLAQKTDSYSPDRVMSPLSSELKKAESTVRLVRSTYLLNHCVRVLEAELQSPFTDRNTLLFELSQTI